MDVFELVDGCRSAWLLLMTWQEGNDGRTSQAWQMHASLADAQTGLDKLRTQQKAIGITLTHASILAVREHKE